jgi:aspartyl-tRNA(Asn)/glutamyl-tRNA(Gln) amidotransferase subunit A
MAGHDPKDSTSADIAVPDYEAAVGRSVKGLKIGVPKEYRADGMSPEIERLWQQGADWLKAAGAEIIEISLPHTKYALPAYYIVAPAEASSNLARFDGVRYGHRAAHYDDLADMYKKTRAEGFGPEVKRRILVGTYVLSHGYYDAYYLKAQQLRRLLADGIKRAYRDCDVIVGPTAPSAAFPIGAKTDDPVAMYLNDIFTVAGNLTGAPAISVPCGFDRKGLPIGLQIQGDCFNEALILDVAHRLQRATDWHKREPAHLAPEVAR